MLKLIVPMMITLMIALSSGSISVLAGGNDSVVFSKDSSPYGVPYGEWLAKWWEWTMSIPKSEHPRDGYSDAKCSLAQEGPVWYLADQLGGKETRTCTVPEGKAIFVPLLVGECDYGNGPENNGSDEKTKTCATEGNEYGTIQASLDGVQLGDVERVQSGFFNMTRSLPTDSSLYSVPPGTFRAFADGYFIILQPLSPGEHDLNLKVSVLNPVYQNYNYNADWTYHLVVQPKT